MLVGNIGWSPCLLLVNSIDDVSLQDADAAVALNLFFSRVTEHKRPCHEMISALAAALPEALSALQAYDAVHTIADEAASAARAAHQQVLEAQVCSGASHGKSSSLYVGYLCDSESAVVICLAY